MALEVVPRRDEITDFLNFLYQDMQGYVYLALKSSDDEFSQNFFQWPSQKQDIYNFIVEHSASGDVYIAPALFKTGASALKENVLGSYVYWTEFDGNAPSNLGEIPAPTIVVQSSTESHLHYYWRADSFITDIAELERVNRALTYRFSADTSAWDCNQILRPPNTINHKRGMATKLVASAPTSIFGPAALGLLPQAPEKSTEFNNTDLLDTASIIAKYQWPKDYFELFRQREIDGDRSIAYIRMAYMCAEMGMTDQEIFSVLYTVDERWGKFRRRNDRYVRLNEYVARARIKHPVGLSTLALDSLPTFGFNDFLQTKVEIEWAITDMLPKTGQVLISSKPGIGKTQLSLQFAIHMALGKQFLHFNIERPFKIAFFSLEMGHASLKKFLADMAGSLTPEELATLQSNFMVVPLGQALYLDKPEGQRKVESMVRDYSLDGYFFDSLGSTTGEELSEKTVKQITDFDMKIRQHYNIFSWFIHHNRKSNGDNKKPTRLEDVYGSQYVTARADTVYTLWPYRNTKNQIEVHNVKKRLAEMEDPFLLTRIPNLNFVETAVVGGLKNTEESPVRAPAANGGQSSDRSDRLGINTPGF